jgi:dihydroorotase
MSIAPAKIGKFETQGQAVTEGAPANLVLLDPDQSWVADEFVSRSKNSPFLGQDLKGTVVATIVNGELVHGGGR